MFAVLSLYLIVSTVHMHACVCVPQEAIMELAELRDQYRATAEN